MNAKRRQPEPTGLAALSHIKGALARAAEEAKAARAAAERAEHERQLFKRSVGPVTPMKPSQISAQALIKTPRPLPHPFQREKDEAAVMTDALSDEMDVEALLETDEDLSFRRNDVGPDVVKRLRRGVWAIDAQLDLHGLRRDEAREALSQFLRSALQQRMRCVRVVHGKGNGSPGREPVLKDKVKRWLVQKEEVMAYVQARAIDGGNGALVVLLKH